MSKRRTLALWLMQPSLFIVWTSFATPFPLRSSTNRYRRPSHCQLQKLRSQAFPISNDELPDIRRGDNPLWPNGVSSEDIDDLVDDIMADPSITNLVQLPDMLERQIYKTTTILTYNAVYRIVGWFHGKQLFGHSFELTKIRSDKDRYEQARQQSLLHMQKDVDENLLEDVANQLLANQAINQPLIPDYIERQLYVNCLKIIFRILNMLAASCRITFCGHDLTLNLSKAIDGNTFLEAAQSTRLKSSHTPIDTTVLRELARFNRDDLDAEMEMIVRMLSNADKIIEKENDVPFWQRCIERAPKEFAIQINTVLYALILGILDDLLANTELVLMTDRIHFDIVPPTKNEPVKSTGTQPPQRIDSDAVHSIQKSSTTNRTSQFIGVAKESSRKRPKLRTALTFLLGASFGIATRFIL